MFQQDSYLVDEQNKTVNATILRLGDLTLPVSVVCFTRQVTAIVNVDYVERANTNESRIHFEPGDRVSGCISGGWRMSVCCQRIGYLFSGVCCMKTN